MSKISKALFDEGPFLEKQSPNDKDLSFGKKSLIRLKNFGKGVLDAAGIALKLPFRVSKNVLKLVKGVSKNVVDVIAEPFETGRE